MSAVGILVSIVTINITLIIFYKKMMAEENDRGLVRLPRMGATIAAIKTKFRFENYGDLHPNAFLSPRIITRIHFCPKVSSFFLVAFVIRRAFHLKINWFDSQVFHMFLACLNNNGS